MKRYKSYNVKTETLESYCHFGFENLRDSVVRFIREHVSKRKEVPPFPNS